MRLAGESPYLMLSVLELSFFSSKDATAPPDKQFVSVFNIGPGVLDWGAKSNVAWATVTLAAPGLTVQVNPGDLAPGTYQGTITVSAPGAANSPQVVAVSLNIDSLKANFTSGPLYYVPMTPCRLLDTRLPPGPFGGPVLAEGSIRPLNVTQSPCSIPAGARAYTLNATVVPRGTLGYLTLWPAGQPRPNVSSVRSVDQTVRGSTTVVPASPCGTINVFATDATDVILDINGYFVDSMTTSTMAFYPLPPCRIADTRNPVGPLGGPMLAGGSTRTFPMQPSPCGVSPLATAYSLNMTVVPSLGTLGYLTAWPTGATQPLTSSLNAPEGLITANAAVVPAGTRGSINVFVTDSTDLVIDINGYFAPPGSSGLSYYPMQPCRLLDTQAAPDAHEFSGVLDVDVVGGPCNVPATARAYSLGVTAIPTPGGSLGYMTLWPLGQAQPLVATLNSPNGAVVANAAIVPAGSSGSVSIYVTDPTHLVLDINGYFAP